MAKKQKPNISRDNFLKMLTCMDRNQIQEFITTKGKEPKMIAPVMIIK